MTFLQAVKRICFSSGAEHAERKRRTEKFKSKLNYLERQLDIEAQQGFGRHFESAGVKIRRASKIAMNNAFESGMES